MKKIFITVMSIILLLGSTLNVSAAGLKDVFSAKYYADRYPDLKAAFGYDEEMLWQHFLDYGLKEGRNMSPIINVKEYREKYADLDAAFGDNWDAYVQHFFDYGINENRDNGTNFDVKTYIEAYDDIEEAFGNDYAAVAEHYLVFGIEENRTKGDPVIYQAEKNAQESSGPIYTYDAEGRVIRVDYVDDDIYFSYEYDEEGRLSLEETYIRSSNYKTDWYEHEYDGNRKYIRGYEADGFMWFEGTYEGEKRIVEYNFERDGSKRSWQDDVDGADTKRTEYDSNGNVLMIEYCYSDGKVTTYSYSDNGSYYVIYYENGIVVGEKWYDENGLLTSIVTVRFLENNKREYVCTDTDDNVTRRYIKDSNDNTISDIWYAEDGSEMYSVQFTYSEDGTLLYSRTKNADGSGWLDEYNERGLQVRQTSYNGNEVLGFAIFSYNEMDLMVRGENYDANGELINYCIITYDEDGNFLYDTYYRPDGTIMGD